MKNKLIGAMVIGFICTSTAYAQQINVINRPDTGSSSSGTSPRVTSDSRTPISASSISHCDSSQHMSQALLQSLMLDPEGVKVEFVNDDLTRAQVHIPRHYSTCLDLDVTVETDDYNNLFVSFKNTRFEDEINSSGDVVKDAYSQYIDCLKDEEVLTEVDGEYQVDAEKMTVRRYESREFQFDQGTFRSRYNVNAHYLGPGRNENGGYSPVYSDEFETMGCYARESMSPEGDLAIYVSPENRAAALAMEACNSGSVSQILRALNELRESEVGNARELELILRNALSMELENEADSIYERMREVARHFESEDGVPKLSRDEARERADEYLSHLHDLNRVILNPYISFIDELMAERENASPERKEEIDELIEDYNKKIQEYSNNSRRYGYDRVMATMRYYADDLSDYARDIEGYNLKSHFYGRYYADGRSSDPRGARVRSKDDISDNIDNKLDQFDGAFNRFAAEDATRTGDTRPLRLAQQRQQSLTRQRDQRWQRDMQEIQQELQQCIGWFHTDFKVQRCQERAQRAQQRALRRRASYNSQIQSAGEDVTNFTGQYSIYQQNQANRQDRDREQSSLFWYEEGYQSSLTNYGLSDPGQLYSLMPQGPATQGRAPSGGGQFQYNIGTQYGSGQPYMSGPQTLPAQGGQMMMPQMQQGQGGYMMPPQF